jgi:hypothetical protein
VVGQTVGAILSTADSSAAPTHALVTLFSVDRLLSILFRALCGKLVFREANIAFRFTDALWMLIGALLITLQGW